MSTLRLLLRPECDRARFDAALLELGLKLVNVLAASTEKPRRVVACTADGRDLVGFVEDHRLGARYVEIRSHDPEPTAKALQEKLPTLASAELRAMIEGGEGDLRVRALLLLAVVEGEGAREKLVASANDAALGESARAGLAWLDAEKGGTR